MRPLDTRLLRYAAATRPFLVAAVLLGLLGAGVAIAQAELLAELISQAFLGGLGLPVLLVPLLVLAAVLAVRAVLGWLTETVAHRASAAARSELRTQLVRHALRLGPRWLSGQRSGELATLTTRGLDALDPYFSRYLPQLVLAAIVPLAVCAWVFTADPLSGVIIACTLPLVPLFMVLVGMHSRAQTERQWRRLARLGHHFVDVVTGLPTLRAFGRAAAQREAIERTTDAYRRATLGTLRVTFLSSLVLELVATFSVALVAVSVGLRLVAGGLDLRTGLLVLILAPEAYLPLRAIGAQFHASAEGLAAAQDAFAVLETEPDVPGGSRRPPRDPAIEIRGLGVDGRAGPVLDGFDLDLPAGRTVGLVGPSGAGKSTVIAVLLGFVRADRGTVTVRAGFDGDRPVTQAVPLGDLDLDAWRAQIAWVPQRPRFSPGTVAAAIRLGAPDASDAAVAAAAGAARLDVALGTVIGEGGGGLSTGQQRRMALARALLTQRPVLLLDEPTEGVDEDTERAMVDALVTAANGRTVLLVTHRPEVLRCCDQVVDLTPRTVAA
jgi:ATP-binding cassette subfamily C protein CydCD